MTISLLSIGCSATGQDHLPECEWDAQVMHDLYLRRHHSAAMPLIGQTLDKERVFERMLDMENVKGVRVGLNSGHGGRQKMPGMKRAEAFIYLGVPHADKVIWAHEFIAVLNRLAANGDPVVWFLDMCHAGGMRKDGNAPRTYKFTNALGPCAEEAEDIADDPKLAPNVILISACGKRQYALGAWPSSLEPPRYRGYNTSTLGNSLATFCWAANMGRGCSTVAALANDAQAMSRHVLMGSVWQGGVKPGEVPEMKLRCRPKYQRLQII